jgi:hypothetical protein
MARVRLPIPQGEALPNGSGRPWLLQRRHCIVDTQWWPDWTLAREVSVVGAFSFFVVLSKACFIFSPRDSEIDRDDVVDTAKLRRFSTNIFWPTINTCVSWIHNSPLLLRLSLKWFASKRHNTYELSCELRAPTINVGFWVIQLRIKIFTYIAR